MDKLGRFYTESVFSELLVKQINSDNPKHILDLGVGDGALLSAAHNKWNNAVFSAIDIEEKDFKDLPRINFIKKDLLCHSGEITLDLSNKLVDIAICNPPYSKISNKIDYSSIFKDIGFTNCLKLKYITTDLLFLAFNLSLLKKDGQLGIILPDTLITSSDFKLFRKDLLKFDIECIIELPDKIFKKTEAKTYILILNNRHNAKPFINLFLANKNGQIVKTLTVGQEQLSKRLDYTYNSYNKIDIVKGTTLKEIGAEISRGRYTRKKLEEKQKLFFHTSDFKGREISLSSKPIEDKKSYAKEHDILIARVGSRVLGKFCLVKRGTIEISDCVFKVSLPSEFVRPFIDALDSQYGRNWFKAHSHGVCAKLISKEDLLEFRIPSNRINKV
nr:N-6 DNA methylase [uncultured Draconibacterium sp.]